MTSKLLSLLLAIFFLTTAGCSKAEDDNLIDRSFLTKESCAPPCWYGLELGRSGKNEVYTTLEQLPFINQASIQETDEHEYLGDTNAIVISWGCFHPLNKSCGYARLAHGKLIMIWQSIGYNLTFKTIVGELGPPGYIDYRPYHPEVGGCVIYLYWPDQNISVGTLDTKHDKVCLAIKQGNGIPENTPVESITYMVKEFFSTESRGFGLHQPWPGFVEP
jgi:hypothetical protein